MTRLTEGRTSVPVDAVILAVCFFLFVHFDMWNYRSADGYLARTVPPWQNAIVAGTAPAPYVYRQAVPQLRHLLGAVLPPGHAAVAVDAVSALIALLAGGAFGRFVQGPRGRTFGMIVTALALLAVFPNDKPESVAMVAAMLLVTMGVLMNRHGWAAAVAILAVAIRPELPILLGCAGLAAAIALLGRAPARRMVLTSLLPLAVGVGYLAMAHLSWWPRAKYPPGTPVITVGWNLRHAFGSPGLALDTIALAIGATWVIRGARTVRSDPELASRILIMGWLVVLWVAAITTFGMAWELRLLAPVLPLCFFLGMAPGPPDTFIRLGAAPPPPPPAT